MYTILSPVFTLTGVLAVSLLNKSVVFPVATSVAAFVSLKFGVLSVIVVSPTLVMYLLNAKSNSLFLISTSAESSSSSYPYPACPGL